MALNNPISVKSLNVETNEALNFKGNNPGFSSSQLETAEIKAEATKFLGIG